MIKNNRGERKTKAGPSGEREPNLPYDGISLLGDPIYGYIRFTSPSGSSSRGEKTEQDLIDSPWMQRLRRIFQLQGAFWVFPSAEHSRFQHALGTMHIAGQFADHLYPSLASRFPDLPSKPYIVSLLRIAGLLHDVGHGPFGHFLDDNFLDSFELNHEVIGQAIIKKKLASLIRGIRRSPAGPLLEGEVLDPKQVAYLIRKPATEARKRVPPWLSALTPLFSGIYTADNLDYVRRDSYMTGVSRDPIDVERLIYYSFFSEKGLTLHQSGMTSLTQFLNARLHLYTNVCYHRAVRAIDIHLREIFRETLKEIFPWNPLETLDKYLQLTDWHLLDTVEQWSTSAGAARLRELGRQWTPILKRRPRWRRAYEFTFSLADYDNMRTFSLLHDEEVLARRIRAALGPQRRGMAFRVDMATQDPRPINPLAMGDSQIHIFDPSTEKIEKGLIRDLFRFIPARVIQCRIYALDHRHDAELARAFEDVFAMESRPTVETNI